MGAQLFGNGTRSGNAELIAVGGTDAQPSSGFRCSTARCAAFLDYRARGRSRPDV